VKEYFWNTAAN